MPPLSIYERGGTAASNNLNADTISRFVRNQYANNRTQANLMVASSILTQNVLVKDLLGKNALIQRREAQLKELDEQLTQYYGEFGSVLNDKALDFLRQMADVKVPTVTSILAGFEGARASRAENERLRVAEMERLMNLDTKLQQERLQIRREQMDAEMLPGQTRIKAMQDLMSNTNTVNSEAFKETKYGGTWQELPQGRIYNAPTASVQPVHDYWVDDRERIYRGGKGSKITDVDDLLGINLGERPSSTKGETPAEEAAKVALALGSEALEEYFIRMGESAPSGDASGWARALGADLKKQLEASTAKHREYSADGQTPFDPYTAIPNNDLINYGKMLAFMRERLNENEALRGHFRSSFPTESANVNLENFVKGYDFGNTGDIIAALRLIPQLFDYSNAFRKKRAGVEASKQEPAGGTSAPTAPATKVEQPPAGGFVPPSETVQQTANAMYFGPEPAGPVVGFNSTGVNPVVSQDAYQNEFAYTAAARQAAAQPVQMGEGFMEAPVQPVQMGQGFIDPMLAAQPIYDRLDPDEEVGDEPTGGVTRRKLDSGVWEFTYPDGRKVYSDSPRLSPSLPGNVQRSDRVGQVNKGVTMPGVYQVTMPDGRIMYSTEKPDYYQGGGVPIAGLNRPDRTQEDLRQFARQPVRGSGGFTGMSSRGIYKFQMPDGRIVYTDNPAGPGQMGYKPGDPRDQAYNVNLGGRDESRAIPRVSGYTEVTGNPPMASRLQRIKGPNGPIYTNVRGGSVLDPSIRPAPVRVSSPSGTPGYYIQPSVYPNYPTETIYQIGDRGIYTNLQAGSVLDPSIRPVPSRNPTARAPIPVQSYPVQTGQTYRNPFSGEQGTVAGYYQTPGVMRVQRPSGEFYATNIDPNMNMGYRRPVYDSNYMPQGLRYGQQVEYDPMSSNRGVVAGAYPGTDIVRVQRPDGTFVDTNVYTSRVKTTYDEIPNRVTNPYVYPGYPAPQVEEPIYPPYNDYPPYDPANPPVRVIRR